MGTHKITRVFWSTLLSNGSERDWLPCIDSLKYRRWATFFMTSLSYRAFPFGSMIAIRFKSVLFIKAWIKEILSSENKSWDLGSSCVSTFK